MFMCHVISVWCRGSSVVRSIDCLIDWLAERITDEWLIDWLIDWLNDIVFVPVFSRTNQEYTNSCQNVSAPSLPTPNKKACTKSTTRARNKAIWWHLSSPPCAGRFSAASTTDSGIRTWGLRVSFFFEILSSEFQNSIHRSVNPHKNLQECRGIGRRRSPDSGLHLQLRDRGGVQVARDCPERTEITASNCATAGFPRAVCQLFPRFADHAPSPPAERRRLLQLALPLCHADHAAAGIAGVCGAGRGVLWWIINYSRRQRSEGTRAGGKRDLFTHDYVDR